MNRRAFTLMEIMIVIAVIMLVFTGSMVGMRALNDETALKKPWDALRPMAKRGWMRALRDQNPWQITFYADKFVLEPRQANNEDDRRAIAAASMLRPRSTAEDTFELDPEHGFTVEVRRWGQKEWVKLEKNMTAVWIFAESGLLEPLSVRFSTEAGGTIGGQFDPLTASVEKELNDRETE